MQYILNNVQCLKTVLLLRYEEIVEITTIAVPIRNEGGRIEKLVRQL